MAMTPWKPFSDLDKILKEETELLKVDQPQMDIHETDNKVIAEFNLPDLDPEKTEITLRDNVLRVKTNTEKKEEKEDKNYWRREIKRGFFERVVTLPASVKEDEIEASYEKGILKIEMEKEKESQNKKIEIKIR